MRKSLVFGIGLVFGCLSVTSASAENLTSGNNMTVEFNFAPVLTMSLSENELIIQDLVPGGFKTSNSIDVTVITNSIYGYYLAATVGDATYNTRNMVHTTAAGAAFESLALSDNVATITAASTWGYSVDDGTSFSGLPLYTDEENVKVLNMSTGAANEETEFMIGAKAAAGQVSGSYQNVINFLSVARPELYVPETMQEVTIDTCPSEEPLTVTDPRDDSEYKVQKLADGRCWMLDNLMLGGSTTYTLTSADSNVANSFTLPASSTQCFSGSSSCSGGNAYTKPGVLATYKDDLISNRWGDGSGRRGVFYNYCAATAGTICQESGIDEAEYDICPAGWKLPSYTEYVALWTSYGKVVDDFKEAFSINYGGCWYGYIYRNGTKGYAWMATQLSNGNNGQHRMGAGNNEGVDLEWLGEGRDGGDPVRCILKN